MTAEPGQHSAGAHPGPGRRGLPELPGYGEGPLHLLGHLALWALAAYAATRLLPISWWAVPLGFLAGIVLHDAVLWPVYGVADQRLARAQRRDHHEGRATPRGVGWINHVRVPAVVSGTLLLLWFPIVLQLADERPEFTGQSQTPFLYRWLGVTAAMAAVSALVYAVRVRRAPRR